MDAKRNPQLLVALVLSGALFSQTLAMPLLEEEGVRIGRQLVDVSSSDLSSPLDQSSLPNDSVPIFEKRASKNVTVVQETMAQETAAERPDVILTVQYTRFLTQKAVNENLRKALATLRFFEE